MESGWLAALRRESGRMETLGELGAACKRVREALSLDYYCLGLRLPTSFVDPDLIVMDDYPQGFRALYERMDGLHTDPVLLQCYEQAAPVFWHEAFARVRRGTAPARYVEAIRALGLRNGVSCGFRGVQGEFAILSLGTGRDDRETHSRLRGIAPQAMLAGAWLKDAASRMVCADPSAGLTPRERECLLWCAEGCSAPAIALRLGIAERTVVFHLSNAVGKLGASTRQQAVARAVALGVVEPRAVSMPEH